MTIFEEPSASVNKIGSIEVVCGSMFSGKTEELIRRLKRAKIANLKVAIFKPSLDIRYHENMIVSHNENILDATPVADPIEIPVNAFSEQGTSNTLFFPNFSSRSLVVEKIFFGSFIPSP